MRQSISLGNALSAILSCHRHPNAWLCGTKQKSRSDANHNSKPHKSDWKKRSGEFEVVAVNLTSLTVAQAAQHMKIIKVNGKNFVRNNRIRQREVELKKAVLTAQLEPFPAKLTWRSSSLYSSRFRYLTEQAGQARKTREAERSKKVEGEGAGKEKKISAAVKKKKKTFMTQL